MLFIDLACTAVTTSTTSAIGRFCSSRVVSGSFQLLRCCCCSPQTDAGDDDDQNTFSNNQMSDLLIAKEEDRSPKTGVCLRFGCQTSDRCYRPTTIPF